MKNSRHWLFALFPVISLIVGGGLFIHNSRTSSPGKTPSSAALVSSHPATAQPSPSDVARKTGTPQAPSSKPQTPVAISAQVTAKLDEELREKPRYDEPDAAIAYYRMKRLPPGEKEIPVEKYLAAKARMDAMPQYSTAQNRFLPSRNEFKANRTEANSEALGTWTPLGPGNIGGRTRALLIHPTSPNVMYAAGVAGGVWKSVLSGSLWQPLNDLMANLAVTCLVFDPSNPNTIYAGTGEGFFNSDAVRGAGIFRTTDAGVTWTQLSGTGTSDFYYVNDIVVSKTNPQHLYAGTRTGVWRSLDAGATWSKVLNYTDGCLDLVIRTDQATDYVFAACGTFGGGEIFRNTDAGGAGAWASVQKEAGMGRTSLALAPSNQNVIYALSASTLSGQFRDGLYAVFRSTSSGDSATWTAQVRNNNPLKLNTVLLTNPLGAFRAECGLSASSFSNQGWYDNVIAVDPLDENKVWAGGIDLFRSDDGGQNWGLASYWWPDVTVPQYAHADQHAIVFHPNYNGTTNKQMFVGNDGGIFRTDDARALVSTGATAACNPAASGVKWTSLNNNYGVTQFYHGAVFPDGKSYFGGTQDNGTLLGTDTTGVNGWREIWGGDGGYVAIDPTNPRVLYASTPGGAFRKSTDGGATFGRATLGISDTTLFIAPLAIDSSNSQRLLTGGQRLWRSENGGASWKDVNVNFFSPASAIAVSPQDSNAIAVGAQNGNVYYSFNANPQFTPTGIGWSSALPRFGFVSSVTHDPANKFTLYATYSTFGESHVWKTTNGSSWSAIDGTGSNRLPDIPVHCLVVDPSNPARLFVGTDLGVFVTTDGGTNWAVENLGFANAPVEWLALNKVGGALSLYAFTHGRGVWRVSIGNEACSYSLGATGNTFSAAGGAGSVAVTASNGCNWIATSNAEWITITSVSSNKVEYSVSPAAPPTNAPLKREGTLTIAGRSYHIVQEGVKEGEVPLIQIVSPPNTSIYKTSRSNITVSLIVTGNAGVTDVVWENDRGGSGSVGSIFNRGDRIIRSLPLFSGRNTITIKAKNAYGNTSQARLVIDSIPVSTADTVAGGGTLTGDNVPALSAQFKNLTGLSLDSQGNIYLTDTDDHRIKKITPNGMVQIIAGTGTPGFSGDGGQAIAAQLNRPGEILVDQAGNIYFADGGNFRIRKITPDGMITTFIGNEQRAFDRETDEAIGQNVPPLQARLLGVASLSFDSSNNFYFADNYRIRRLSAATGLVSTYAGFPNSSGASGSGGPARNASLWDITDIEADGQGGLFTAERQLVRRINKDGIINNFGGTGKTNFNFVCDPEPEGVPADMGCFYATKLARDQAGNLYVSSGDTIWRITPENKLYTVVSGLYFPNDGTTPSPQTITGISTLAVDKSGAIYFLDNNRLKKVIPLAFDTLAPLLDIVLPTTSPTWTSTVSTLNLQCNVFDSGGLEQVILRNDRGGSIALSAPSVWSFNNVLLQPGPNLLSVTAWDIAGNSTTKKLLVQYVVPNTLTTLAGTRTAGVNLETGSGLAAQLYTPETVALDSAGNLYIADKGNHRIRKVTRSGLISTVAGNGQLGSSGDGGLATQASMNQPNAVVVDGAGNLYISDTNNHRIRKVTPAGIITTIAGVGLPGFGGDGGAGTQALFNTPEGLVLDAAGNLLIADGGNHRVRKLNLSTGVIATIAGNGYGSGGDGGQATQAQLNFPTGVVLDANGNLYIAETSNHQVRKVTPAGIISRYAGAGTRGFSGDGGQAVSAQFSAPGGLAVDAAGNLYVADQGNNRVRKIAPDGTITTVAGNGNTQNSSDEGGTALNASLNAPAGVAVDGAGNLFIADAGNHRVVIVAAYKSAATVNGASFATQQPVAPEAIVSVFGANLATRDQAVTQLPLPTELAGTSVKVRDSLGVERLAPLFYVGKLQVNYQIPTGTAAGFATVTITNGNGEIFTSAVNVTGVMPGFFTANQNGSGVPAGSVLYVTGANRRTENLAVCDANGQNCTPRQIDLNAASEVYLELYATGLRQHSGLANVSVTVGGVAVPVLYAGPQPQFVGLDQINVQLPRSLAGRGEVDIVLTVDGKIANAVKVNFK